MSAIAPFDAAFRARLQVHKQDEEAARQILGASGDELSEEELDADDEK